MLNRHVICHLRTKNNPKMKRKKEKEKKSPISILRVKGPRRTIGLSLPVSGSYNIERT